MIVRVSSIEDGTMKHAIHTPERQVKSNRQKFLANAGIHAVQTSLIRIQYGSDNYCRYGVADGDNQGDSMELWHDTPPLDGMMTDELGHAIFLPVGDCGPMVVSDTMSPAFMMSHVGRHSVEQDGGRRSIEVFCKTYGIDPSTLRIWLGPMVGKESYPLRAFDGRGLENVILEQLMHAGIDASQIESAGVDTAKDKRYFSHSEYKKGNRELDGRIAVVAMRRAV